MLARVGFLPPTDPRIIGTVDAIQRELLVDGFVLRYITHDGDSVDGLPAGEGTFLMTTFWLADNLALIGRDDEARAVFERLRALSNDVGLFSEEYDPKDEAHVGELPAGLLAPRVRRLRLAPLGGPPLAAHRGSRARSVTSRAGARAGPGRQGWCRERRRRDPARPRGEPGAVGALADGVHARASTSSWCRSACRGRSWRSSPTTARVKHDDADALLLAQRWSKYMAVTFAVGAVTGHGAHVRVRAAVADASWASSAPPSGCRSRSRACSSSPRRSSSRSTSTAGGA